MTHPLVRTYEAHMDAEGTAGTPSEAVICRAPFAGTLSAARYIPEADITGVATNNKAVRIRNRGSDGNGTTVMAELVFASGTNATDFTASTVTLSGTAANLACAAGDIITCQTVVNGTGMTLPAGKVEIDLSRS